MPKVLIIGWGNPLRGDDGVGWRAAEQLQSTLSRPDASVRVSHQLLPEFAEEMSRSELVIFVDAACDNGISGEISLQKVEPRRPSPAAFTHQLDPPTLLGMSEALYGSRPEAYFFTVRGRAFGYGEQLSPEVQSALPELIEEIEQLAAGSHSYLFDSRKAT